MTSSPPVAKRRRLTTTEEAEKRDEATAGKFQIPSGEILQDPKRCMMELRRLKKHLLTNEQASSFASDPKNIPSFLVAVFRLAENDLKIVEYGNLLREGLSILANCCHFSLAACVQVSEKQTMFNRISDRIFQSPAEHRMDLCNCVLRLLGNLCQHKETALVVIQDRILLARNAAFCESPMELRKNAVRIVKLLIGMSSAYARFQTVLTAHTAFHIGRIMFLDGPNPTRPVKITDYLPILQRLAAINARDVGRQLAAGDCAESLLRLFIGKRKIGGELLDFIVEIALVTLELRESLQTVNAIERIVGCLDAKTTKPDDQMATDGRLAGTKDEEDKICRLLSIFAHDAWGRLKLRETGGLFLLIGRLSVTGNVTEQFRLVHALKQFVHDRLGIALLSHGRQNYLDTMIRHIRNYSRKNLVQCEPIALRPSTEEDIEGQTVYRCESPPDYRVRNQPNEEVDMGFTFSTTNPEIPLYKDFYAPTSPTIHRSWSSPTCSSSSMTAMNNRAWSPSMSPLASSLGSCCVSPGSSNQGDASAMSPMHSDDGGNGARSFVDDLFLDNTTEDAAQSTEQIGPVDLEQQLIASELFLISWHSHIDQTLPSLIRADLIDMLLLHLKSGDEISNKTVRILMRMVRSRNEVENLLALQIHSRILQSLCRNSCRLNRLIERCTRCESLSRIGNQLLSEFKCHADSDFAVAYLSKRLLRPVDEQDAQQAAVAGVTLIRYRFRKIKIFKDCAVVERLVTLFGELLQQENGVQLESAIGIEETLCDQIIGALSTLVPFHKYGEILDSDNSVHLQQLESDTAIINCQLLAEPVDPDHLPPHVAFENSTGQLIARISKEAICSRSDYFQGMYGSSFAENLDGNRINRFMFDEEAENCSQSHFERFLHFLAGCRHVECFSVMSAHCALAMLQFSDRYLCKSLWDFLLETNGPVRRFMNGNNLYEFLIIALSTAPDDRLMDVCLAVLLRYSNRNETLIALDQLASRPAMNGAFLNHLRRFLNGFLNYS